MTYDDSWRAEDDMQISAVAIKSEELGIAVRALANITQGIIGRFQVRREERDRDRDALQQQQQQQILTVLGNLGETLADFQVDIQKQIEELRQRIEALRQRLDEAGK